MRKAFQSAVRQGAVAVAAGLLAGSAFAQVIDFSSTRGSGVSQSDVLIENIRLLVPVANPFQPGTTTTVETSYNVMFRFDPATLHLVPVGLQQTGGQGTELCATANVSVFDALRGASMPIADASVTLGRQTVQTNAQGVATFTGLPASLFGINAVASNYVPASQSTLLTCAAPNNIAIALSPSSQSNGGLVSGQFRTILTWGENPRDLDSHMSGPDVNADQRWHVYYSNKLGGDMCGLDVDDTSSFGPETVTCPRTNDAATSLRPGVYRYSVHHYSGTGNIGNSGANVRLELPGGQTYTFTPPAGGYVGYNDVWTVYELTVAANGSMSVAPVNAIMNGVSAGSVRSSGGGTSAPDAQFGTAEDAALFRGLRK